MFKSCRHLRTALAAPHRHFHELQHIQQDSALFRIDWKDGTQAQYDPLFLRDNCDCPNCYHQSSRQKIADIVNTIPLDIQGQAHLKSSETVEIHWDDGHTSEYTSEWLREHLDSFQAAQVLPERKIWRHEQMQDQIQRFSFHQVLDNDVVLRDFIMTLSVSGVAVLDNAPCEKGQVKRIAERASPLGLLRTNYGDTFAVENKYEPNNLAYTNKELPLHSDLCYYKNKPDIQMLHCIQQASFGGKNTLVDAFQVADDFEHQHPQHYERLCTTPLTFVDFGEDTFGPFHLQLDRPIIERDLTTCALTCINVSDTTRHSCLRLPAEEMKEFYAAYYEFCHFLNSSNYVIEYRMEDGEILCFDNNRVLHGRRAFQVNSEIAQVRSLEGGYMTWDSVYSRFRTMTATANSS